MSHGSKVAVYTAITANAIVMVAKLAGFAVTGSGSMLSEGIHSAADVGNQALLAVGMKSAERAPDETHPDGYGNEAFVWSLISAVGMFFLGCGVSMTHGIQSLMDSHGHHDSGDSQLNLAILVGALIIEGISLGIAVKTINDTAKSENQSLIAHLKETDDPFGVAVLAEDSAAVFGVTLALIAVGLTAATGEVYWDAIGSIAIGVLLGGVAVFLISKNRALLLGRAIRDADRARLQEILENDPAVEGVAVSQAVVTGTDTYRISAELDFDGAYLADKYLETHDLAAIHKRVADPEELKVFLHEYGEAVMEQVGDEVDRIEEKIRTVLPKASNIALEPD